jgi:hypothetical protein
MSRLKADRESRGGNNDAPGADEEDSVMWVNLAEGCEAVNDETRRVVKISASLSCSFGLFGLFCLSGLFGCIRLTRWARQTK